MLLWNNLCNTMYCLERRLTMCELLRSGESDPLKVHECRFHWYGGVTVLRTAGLGYLEVIWIVLQKVFHGQ
jgi:hypothetical protein